jgi:TetR/AcrR family fatty acid metabolism transcriptional regulator
MARLTQTARQTLTEERHRQILTAAIRVFAQKGYAAATIHDVARAARVAEGTIYNYFRSKEDLLISIPRHIAGPVFERLAVGLRAARTPADAERELVGLGMAMVERVTANLRFVKVFLSALPYLSRRAREEYLRQLPLAAAGVLETHLRTGMTSGLYRPDLDPALVARSLPGMMFMFVVLQHVFKGGRLWRQSHEAVVRENVRLFLNGALNHAAVRQPSRQG